MTSRMKAALLHGANDIRIEPHRVPELTSGMVRLRNRRAGICGSDLHYYEHGHCAGFVPDRPFILGHELCAEVAAVANDVDSLTIGQRVTVNPARSCGFCEYCKSGRLNLCRKIVMLGSASTKPPTDGGLAEYVMVRWDQCHVLPAQMDDGIGAMIEPLAVALHAVKRAGIVSGKRVFVAGAGTIGMLVALTAQAFGAVPVVISDIAPARRKMATEIGFNLIMNPLAKNLRNVMLELTGDGFDVVFEASGAAPALRNAFNLVRPGGAIVQIGTLGTEDIPIPANQIMVQEINFIGSMRYVDVFDEAIRLAAAGRINLHPFIKTVFPLDQSANALRHAGDKSSAGKVQIEM